MSCLTLMLRLEACEGVCTLVGIVLTCLDKFLPNSHSMRTFHGPELSTMSNRRCYQKDCKSKLPFTIKVKLSNLLTKWIKYKQ